MDGRQHEKVSQEGMSMSGTRPTGPAEENEEEGARESLVSWEWADQPINQPTKETCAKQVKEVRRTEVKLWEDER